MGVESSKYRFRCSFVILIKKKGSKKIVILSYSRRSFVFKFDKSFLMLFGTRTTASVTNIFGKADYKKPIFQGLKSKVLFDIETKGQVFCIALGPVTICISIGTIELLYLFYNTG